MSFLSDKIQEDFPEALTAKIFQLESEISKEKAEIILHELIRELSIEQLNILLLH